MSHEAEMSVLGTLLIDDSYKKDLRLQEYHFATATHQKIYAAMLRIDKVDPVTVSSELGDMLEQVGGITYLVDLADSVPDPDSVKFYESNIFESYRERERRKILIEHSQDATDEGTHELMQQLKTINEEGIVSTEKTVADYLLQIGEEILADEHERTLGHKTNFDDYDAVTGGLQQSDLIIIGARPSMGKTAFMLNLAKNHCENGGHSHIYSLEMPPVALLKRLISSVANIDASKWFNYNLNEDDIDKAMTAIGIISDWQITIGEGIKDIESIASDVRNKTREGDNHVVFIDYLQMLKSNKRHQNRNLEIGSVTADLKTIARDANVPVIVLSQLSRGVESREDKRPMMSDLRESGEIEQAADLIAFLYRDEYYNKEHTEQKNIAELIIGKHRNGATGTLEFGFYGKYNKFINLNQVNT